MKLALLIFSAFISLTTAIEGTFQTPLDHFRNQDGRRVRFVSFDYFFVLNLRNEDFDNNNFVAIRREC